jgi:predicted nucleotidyltransferase
VTSPSGSLSRLAERTGSDFPHLHAARLRSERELAALREQLGSLPRDGDASVVMLGSWGRRELTSQSDADFLVLVAGAEREDVRPRDDQLRSLLGTPGATGVFGATAFCDNLVSRIGLDQDDNSNLTRRMLLMLESVPAAGGDAYRDCWERVLDGYLVDSVRDRHPPRFFLNDLIRYWRTICVDFVGKERGEPEKWGLRTAKLRTARKLLFASGLLPALLCGELDRGEMRDFLIEQFAAPPADRVAYAFLHADAADAGLRTLRAYDRWLALLDDADVRGHLAKLTREETARSDVFQEVRRLGVDIEQGLLALLFDTQPLRGLTREYAIF